jgi:hypothetical protein
MKMNHIAISYYYQDFKIKTLMLRLGIEEHTGCSKQVKRALQHVPIV